MPKKAPNVINDLRVKSITSNGSYVFDWCHTRVKPNKPEVYANGNHRIWTFHPECFEEHYSDIRNIIREYDKMHDRQLNSARQRRVLRRARRWKRFLRFLRSLP